MSVGLALDSSNFTQLIHRHWIALYANFMTEKWKNKSLFKKFKPKIKKDSKQKKLQIRSLLFSNTH